MHVPHNTEARSRIHSCCEKQYVLHILRVYL